MGEAGKSTMRNSWTKCRGCWAFGHETPPWLCADCAARQALSGNEWLPTRVFWKEGDVITAKHLNEEFEALWEATSGPRS